MTEKEEVTEKRKPGRPKGSKAARTPLNAVRAPRLISKRVVQSGLRERIAGEDLIDRLADLTHKLGRAHDEGRFLTGDESRSARLEADLITKQLSYILPQLSAMRVENNEKEHNIIESGVIELPAVEDVPLIGSQQDGDK